MTTQIFETLVAEYIADPNCPPYLWISEETPDETERMAFCLDRRIMEAFKNQLKKEIKALS